MHGLHLVTLVLAASAGGYARPAPDETPQFDFSAPDETPQPGSPVLDETLQSESASTPCTVHDVSSCFSSERKLRHMYIPYLNRK